MGDISTWTKWQVLDACAISALAIVVTFLGCWGLWVGLDIIRGALEGRARRADGPYR